MATFREKLIEFAKDVITDDDVQKSLEAMFARLMKNHVEPLIPIAVQTAVPIAVKTAIEQVFKQAPGLQELAEDAIDTVEVINQTRQELDRILPDIDLGKLFGLPGLDAITDIWRPKPKGPQ